MSSRYNKRKPRTSAEAKLPEMGSSNSRAPCKPVSFCLALLGLLASKSRRL